MPIRPLSVVIQHLRADLSPDGDGMTDGELLARFLGSRDDCAITALVRRHASMVWGVCRRLLSHHDAEDAFQATFLVLVRKAANVPEQAVGNWLYGVARQTAVRLRVLAAKRRQRETQAVNMPEPTVPEVRDADVQVVVDEEVSRLPAHYRGVVVLCDLEGVTRTEVARQLGLPEGSVASRLARARAMLAKRLTRRGVVLFGSVAVPSVGTASASAPPTLVESTIQTASLLAAGQTAGVVTAQVAALTDGVVKAMLTTKIKCVQALGLALGVAVITGGSLVVGLAGGKPPAQERAKAPDDPAERLVGTWTVKFENEVNEWCRVGKDRTAKVVEPQRRSPGKVEIRAGAVLIVCDDDRLERWTPVGDGAVVEHWCPASGYPKQKPVKGIAERTTADEPPELPLHFVEKPNMKPLFDSYNKVDGEPDEELIRVYSKHFISDSRNPGKIRFRDFIDPRYLKKHGLTDRDLAYEIGDDTGLRNYHVADDIRTILIEVDAKGGGRELIIVRWVLHEGRLYLSPAPPDPKTGIFKLWILRTKLVETKPSPQPVPNDKQPEKPSHLVEKPGMKARMESGLPEKVGRVGGEPTEEDVRIMSKRFFSKMRTYPDIRFREFFDPRYLKKHGLTEKDIAFEVAGDVGIHNIVVADDNRTVLCTVDTTKDGKTVREIFLLRWVLHDGCLYMSPEKVPDEKTGIFTPWILRTKVN